MSSSRSSFLSGTIFGVVLGAVLGHVTIWRFVDSKPSKKVQPYPVVEDVPNGMSYDLGQKSAALPFYSDEPNESSLDAQEPEYHSFGEAESPLANAIAVETVEIEAVNGTDPFATAEAAAPAKEPKPLDIAEAAPIGILQKVDEINPQQNATKDKEIREVIDKELAGTPQAQRDIWFESLKEMHVGDATGVIRMWKAVGGPIPGFGEDSLILSPSSPGLPETPIFSTADANDQNHQTTLALEKSISIHQRNILMSTSFGYRRIIPRLTEEIIDGVPTVTGIVEEFDFTLGQSVQTGNPLDLKIEGGGMFLVADAEGQKYLTRRGRFSLNKDRQLCLVDPGAEYVLQPPVTVPASVFQINPYGKVEALEGLNDDGKSLENDQNHQVQLVLVTNPDQLRVSKNGLLKLTDKETPLILVPPGQRCGHIKQGVLELSNVKLDHEREQIEQLRGFIAE